MLTNTLIPKNGTWITEAHSPAGFYVAKYDHEGFTSDGRWFPTLEKAQAYARSVS